MENITQEKINKNVVETKNTETESTESIDNTAKVYNNRENESDTGEEYNNTLRESNNNVIDNKNIVIDSANNVSGTIDNSKKKYRVVFFIRYYNERECEENIILLFSKYGEVDHIYMPVERKFAFIYMNSLNDISEYQTRNTITNIIRYLQTIDSKDRFRISVARHNYNNTLNRNVPYVKNTLENRITRQDNLDPKKKRHYNQVYENQKHASRYDRRFDNVHNKKTDERNDAYLKNNKYNRRGAYNVMTGYSNNVLRMNNSMGNKNNTCNINKISNIKNKDGMEKSTNSLE